MCINHSTFHKFCNISLKQISGSSLDLSLSRIMLRKKMFNSRACILQPISLVSRTFPRVRMRKHPMTLLYEPTCMPKTHSSHVTLCTCLNSKIYSSTLTITLVFWCQGRDINMSLEPPSFKPGVHLKGKKKLRKT